jgi:hypothetical protein
VQLGTQVVDHRSTEVRRRVQQAPLATAVTKTRTTRSAACCGRASNTSPVRTSRSPSPATLRSACHAGPQHGPGNRREGDRRVPHGPIPEVARLGRTLCAWWQQVLAYFDTDGVSNGGTEAINLIIEKVRRLPRAFATSAITGCGSCSPRQEIAPTELGPTMPNSEEPL